MEFSSIIILFQILSAIIWYYVGYMCTRRTISDVSESKIIGLDLLQNYLKNIQDGARKRMNSKNEVNLSSARIRTIVEGQMAISICQLSLLNACSIFESIIEDENVKDNDIMSYFDFEISILKYYFTNFLQHLECSLSEETKVPISRVIEKIFRKFPNLQVCLPKNYAFSFVSKKGSSGIRNLLIDFKQSKNAKQYERIVEKFLKIHEIAIQNKEYVTEERIYKACKHCLAAEFGEMEPIMKHLKDWISFFRGNRIFRPRGRSMDGFQHLIDYHNRLSTRLKRSQYKDFKMFLSKKAEFYLQDLFNPLFDDNCWKLLSFFKLVDKKSTARNQYIIYERSLQTDPFVLISNLFSYISRSLIAADLERMVSTSFANNIPNAYLNLSVMLFSLHLTLCRTYILLSNLPLPDNLTLGNMLAALVFLAKLLFKLFVSFLFDVLHKNEKSNQLVNMIFGMSEIPQMYVITLIRDKFETPFVEYEMLLTLLNLVLLMRQKCKPIDLKTGQFMVFIGGINVNVETLQTDLLNSYSKMYFKPLTDLLPADKISLLSLPRSATMLTTTPVQTAITKPIVLSPLEFYRLATHDNFLFADDIKSSLPKHAGQNASTDYIQDCIRRLDLLRLYCAPRNVENSSAVSTAFWATLEILYKEIFGNEVDAIYVIDCRRNIQRSADKLLIHLKSRYPDFPYMGTMQMACHLFVEFEPPLLCDLTMAPKFILPDEIRTSYNNFSALFTDRLFTLSSDSGRSSVCDCFGSLNHQISQNYSASLVEALQLNSVAEQNINYLLKHINIDNIVVEDIDKIGLKLLSGDAQIAQNVIISYISNVLNYLSFRISPQNTFIQQKTEEPGNFKHLKSLALFHVYYLLFKFCTGAKNGYHQSDLLSMIQMLNKQSKIYLHLFDSKLNVFFLRPIIVYSTGSFFEKYLIIWLKQVFGFEIVEKAQQKSTTLDDQCLNETSLQSGMQLMITADFHDLKNFLAYFKLSR